MAHIKRIEYSCTLGNSILNTVGYAGYTVPTDESSGILLGSVEFSEVENG